MSFPNKQTNKYVYIYMTLQHTDSRTFFSYSGSVLEEFNSRHCSPILICGCAYKLFYNVVYNVWEYI